MTLNLIRLESVGEGERADSDPREGYLFQAPLTEEGTLDSDAFEIVSNLCRVRRFARHTVNESGQLVRTEEGWAFSCVLGESDETPIVRLVAESFRIGDVVTITEPDGEARSYRVVSIEEVPLLRVG